MAVNLSLSVSLEQYFTQRWYSSGRSLWWLWPLSLLYFLISGARRLAWQLPSVANQPLAVPVIVVGNITVGGSGKTPLIIALCKSLQAAGFKPGIVSRGYGSHAPHYPYRVSSSDSADCAGDEPLLIARNTQCPVVIGADRYAAARYLVRECDVNLLLSDDGLQHYALPRDIEIAVIDATRGLGNGCLLPSGPLRELPTRLRGCDWVLMNGSAEPPHAFQASASAHFAIQPQRWVNLRTQAVRELKDFASQNPVHALAGIGNPQRFYSTLDALGVASTAHSFPDHHAYQLEDVMFAENLPLVMTEKDAVKIQPLLNTAPEGSWANCWYLQVAAECEPGFLQSFHARVAEIMAAKTEHPTLNARKS